MPMKQKKIKECLEIIKNIEIGSLEGDHEAQNSLGARLACGDYCLEKNERGAVYWYAQALKQGNVESKWNIATMIQRGEGIKQNIGYALHLIEQAAAEGQIDACQFLRDVNENGYYGVTVDHDKSLHYQNLYEKFSKHSLEGLGMPVDIEADLGIKLKKPVLEL